MSHTPHRTGGSQQERILADLRRLRRSRSDRVVAGVCGGVGRSIAVDPVLVRVVVAVLVLFGGAGIILYAAGWALLPEEDGKPSILERTLGHRLPRDHGSPALLIIVIVVGLALASVVSWGPFWQALILVGMVIVGVAALSRRHAEESRDDSPAPDATDGRPRFDPADPADPESGTRPDPLEGPLPDPIPAGHAPRVGSGPPDPTFWDQPDPLGLESDVQVVPLDPREHRAEPGPSNAAARGVDWREQPAHRHSVLFPVTFCAVLVAVGLLTMVSGGVGGEALAARPATYIAVALAIVGLGLVVGTWYGRSRGLIALGLLLALALVPVTAVTRIVDGNWTVAPDRAIRPASVHAIQPSYRYGAGQLALNLSQVDFTANARTRVQVGAGQVVVTVPRTVDVDVRVRDGMGHVALFGKQGGGADTVMHRRDNGPDGPGGGHLRLDLRLGAGEVVVRRG